MYLYYISGMEKNTKEFEQVYSFNNKEFTMNVILNLTTGESDIWCMEKGAEKFRFSISRNKVHRDRLFDEITSMEDMMHEHSLKPDMDLVIETIIDKGFKEVNLLGNVDLAEYFDDQEG